MTLVMPLFFVGVMHLHIKIIETEMYCFNKLKGQNYR